MIRQLINKTLEVSSHALSCIFMNCIQIILNKKVRFYYDKQDELFYAKEVEVFHYFNEKLRGFYLYGNGINSRSINLAKTYFINTINFDYNDTIFDCGANTGDLFPFLSKLIDAKNYHSFEPSYSEFKSIKKNAPNSKNNNIGLHMDRGFKTFYIDSEGANSSFIEPADGYKNKVQIETTTIDDYCFENKIKKIKLLKLESEGLEPEILLGSKKTLKNIEFIAIDGGEERGIEMNETLSDVCNILIPKNFELLKVGLKNKMGRAIFKNKKFTN